MDVVALSMGLSQIKVAQQANISLLKMAMNTSENQAIDLIQMLELSTKEMEQSVNPHLGKNIDISL